MGLSRRQLGMHQRGQATTSGSTRCSPWVCTAETIQSVRDPSRQEPTAGHGDRPLAAWVQALRPSRWAPGTTFEERPYRPQRRKRQQFSQWAPGTLPQASTPWFPGVAPWGPPPRTVSLPSQNQLQGGNFSGQLMVLLQASSAPTGTVGSNHRHLILRRSRRNQPMPRSSHAEVSACQLLHPSLQPQACFVLAQV